MQRGQLEEAERYSQSALAIMQEVQDRRGEAFVLVQFGTIAEAQSAYEPAAVQSLLSP